MTNLKMNTVGSVETFNPPRTPSYHGVFDSHIELLEEPVEVCVLDYYCQPSLPWADNPDDYYGYTEFEYELRDLNGNLRPDWDELATDNDTDRLLEEYKQVLNDQLDPADYSDF